MVQINFAQKQVNAKIVYYGPGMSGKTTNLEVVHQRAPSTNRGELTSISTDGDRTLFFDYMPLDLGTVAGMKTAFQLYTVPGQVYYNSTRKLVLQGVDGVIFVADSSRSMLEQNLESLRNLEENLNEYGKSLNHLPYTIQYNKRDLPDAMPVEELNAKLNRHGVPHFEGVANTGQGVFPTLKCLAALVLQNILNESTEAVGGANDGPSGSAPAAEPAAPGHAPAGAAPAAAQRGAAEPRAPMPAAPAAAAPPQSPAFAQPAAYGAPPPGSEAAPPGAYAPAAAALQAAPAAPAAPAVMEEPAAAARRAAQARMDPARPVLGTSPRTRPQRTTRRAPSRRTAPVRSPRNNTLFTAVFVVLAAAVGALLASAVLSAL